MLRRFLSALLIAACSAVAAPAFSPEPDDDASSVSVVEESRQMDGMLEARRKVFEKRQDRQAIIVKDMGAASYNRVKAIREAERSGGMVGSRRAAAKNAEAGSPVATVAEVAFLCLLAGLIVWTRIRSRHPHTDAGGAGAPGPRPRSRARKSATDFRLIR